MAVFRVEKSKNYTVMSNYHLKDRRLSLKAKGLMSQMLSLPENWDYTLHGLTCINCEKVDAIRKAINELEDCGYIHRSRDRNEKGHLTGAIYTIHEEPQVEITEKNDSTDGNPMNADFSPALDYPTLDNPILEKPMLGKPMLENPMQLNTNISNTKKINIDVIKNPSINHEIEKTTIDRIDLQQEIEEYREIIHENIEYDIMVLNSPKEKEYIDEIVDIMLECVVSRGYIKVNGQELPSEIVKSRMLKLNYGHIEYILHCMKETTTKIHNIRAYLITTIYNAPTTENNYWQSEYNHDFRGNRSERKNE